jgi:glutamate 5-kinase
MNAKASRGGRPGGGRRIVLKVGSQVLTKASGLPDEERVGAIAADLARVREEGDEVLLVTSGAIAYGRKAMGLEDSPRSVAFEQMLASVGQVMLIDAYRRAMAEHGLIIGQVLLTHSDFDVRGAYHNAHKTLLTLLAHGAVPVLNENDAVGHEEIRFGDNDRLAALVSAMVEADLLVLLTVPDGLYESDPETNPDARRIERVAPQDPILSRTDFGGGTALGKGGMRSKVEAARSATRAGISVILASALHPHPLRRVIGDESVGTRFDPEPIRLERRRHWVRYGRRSRGVLVLDEGAAKALTERGASVLPVGIREVFGGFGRGDAVTLRGPDGEMLGRGLAAYPADELRRIAGHRSDAISEILGYRYLDVAVHRDDLVLARKRG